MSNISFTAITDGSSTVKVPLTKGMFAIIDSEDYDLVKDYSWIYSKHKTNHYAHTTIRIDGKRTTVKMHRLITNAPAGKEIDHINSDGLDNRKSNLRVCSRAENQANSRVKSSSLTGVKGVHKRKDCIVDSYRVHIHRNGRKMMIGKIKTLSEAIKIRNEYIKKIDGTFARLEKI